MIRNSEMIMEKNITMLNKNNRILTNSNGNNINNKYNDSFQCQLSTASASPIQNNNNNHWQLLGHSNNSTNHVRNNTQVHSSMVDSGNYSGLFVKVNAAKRSPKLLNNTSKQTANKLLPVRESTIISTVPITSSTTAPADKLMNGKMNINGLCEPESPPTPAQQSCLSFDNVTNNCLNIKTNKINKNDSTKIVINPNEKSNLTPTLKENTKPSSTASILSMIDDLSNEISTQNYTSPKHNGNKLALEDKMITKKNNESNKNDNNNINSSSRNNNNIKKNKNEISCISKTTTNKTVLLLSPNKTQKNTINNDSKSSSINICDMNGRVESNSPSRSSKSLLSNETLVALLTTLQSQNKNFVREIEDLRIKLEDAEGDLKIVRCQMRTLTKQMDAVAVEAANERNLLDETLSNEIEFYKQKVTILEQESGRIKQEKDAAEHDRQDERTKNLKLNQHLLELMRNITAKDANDRSAATELSADLDALFLENRYLKEKIEQEDIEKSHLLEQLDSLKQLIEHSSLDATSVNLFHKKSSQKINGNTIFQSTLRLPNGHLVTSTEIEQLIDSHRGVHSMEVNKQNQIYLWNILVAMFENLQSKHINLSETQEINRILNQRIEDLELRSSTARNLIHNTNHHLPHHHHQQQQQQQHHHNQTRFDSLNSNKKLSNTNNNKTLLSVDESLSGKCSPCLSKISPSEEMLRLDSTSTESSAILCKNISEESDEPSTTEMSTPSTTRHSAMSIEKELEALRNDALSDITIDTFTACNRHYVDYGNISSPNKSTNNVNHKVSTYLMEHHK